MSVRSSSKAQARGEINRREQRRARYAHVLLKRRRSSASAAWRSCTRRAAVAARHGVLWLGLGLARSPAWVALGLGFGVAYRSRGAAPWRRMGENCGSDFEFWKRGSGLYRREGKWRIGRRGGLDGSGRRALGPGWKAVPFFFTENNATLY
jgi:hypothetical protein